MKVDEQKEVTERLADIGGKLRLLELKSQTLSGDTLSEIAHAHQELCELYAFLSTFYPNTSQASEALRLIHYGRRMLYGKRLATAQVIKKGKLLKRLPVAFAQVRGYCAIAACIFILSAVVTVLMVSLKPSLGWHMLSEEAISNLTQGKLWTDEIQGMSSLASSKIATNNIGVAFTAFALGIAGGLGTFLIIIVNGASLGGIFCVVAQYNMAFELFTFIVAHGVLEISVILVAAGCGLFLGDALISPGSLSRKHALQKRARPAIDVVLFSALCLIPAGLVEGYVSPEPRIAFEAKLALGLFLGVAYWFCLLRGKDAFWFKTSTGLFFNRTSVSGK